MAVKAYNLLLIFVRVIALGFIVYWAYVFVLAILPTPGGFAMPGFEEMARSARGQAQKNSLISIGAGLVLYYLAPTLAWAATRGLKKKDGGEYDEYS